MNTELNDKVSSFINWKKTDLGRLRKLQISLFNPTECAECAELVLDRIVALGWMVTVYTGPYKEQGVKCRCCIMRGPQDFVLGGVDVIAETRPMAICKAFVQAMKRWGDE